MIRPASRLAALSAALVLFAGVAVAQPQPSASQLATAKELVTASGMNRTFEPVVPGFVERIKQNAVTRPELTKDLDQVLEALKPEMELQKQQMINKAAVVLTRHLTEPEMKEILAFFKSPMGQKWVQSQPAIVDDLVKEMQDWTRDVAEYMMVRVRAEMAKRGHQM